MEISGYYIYIYNNNFETVCELSAWAHAKFIRYINTENKKALGPTEQRVAEKCN